MQRPKYSTCILSMRDEPNTGPQAILQGNERTQQESSNLIAKADAIFDQTEADYHTIIHTCAADVTWINRNQFAVEDF